MNGLWSANSGEHKKLIAAAASALVLTFFPKTITPVLFRVTKKPMTIHVTREVPPREAFDDLFYSPAADKDWEEIRSSPSTNLNEESFHGTYNWSPSEAGKPRVFLPAMKFNKEMIANNSFAPEGSAWVAELPKAERERLEEADDRSQVMSQDWSIPSWRSLVAEKINQARMTAPYPTNKIYVAAKTPDGHVATPASSYQVADVHLMSAKPVGTKISGSLRLAPGIALGDRSLEIRRFVDGVPIEAGQVNVEKGSFALQASEAEGVISAELSDASGAILASGSHRLNPDEDLNHIEINLTAKSQFAGTFVNFNRDPSRLISEKLSSVRGEPADIMYASLNVEGRTDSMGAFQFPKVSESSFGLVRARAKGFADSLITMGAGEAKGIALMPYALVSALKEIVQGPKVAYADSSGLAWGQVLFNGKPISGVSLSLQEDPSMKPVYLDGFIPQIDLSETTENGYFVFMGLPKGMHTVIASKDGDYVGHLNIEVDDNSVSTGNLEINTKRQAVPLKVYDAFEGTPQSAHMTLQSLTESFDVMGQTEINLPQIQRLSYGFVQPDQPEYLPYQFVYHDRDDFLHAPLIKQQWLEGLVRERRITSAPNTGVIVGFVPEDGFEAFLSQEETYDASNIVYFDSQGKVAMSGVAGGGFVMFNVPQNTQTLVVMSKKTEMIATQVIPVEVNSTSVLKFQF